MNTLIFIPEKPVSVKMFLMSISPCTIHRVSVVGEWMLADIPDHNFNNVNFWATAIPLPNAMAKYFIQPEGQIVPSNEIVVDFLLYVFL